MNKKIVAVSALVLAVILSFASCKQLDVVGEQSVKSFKAIVNAVPDKVTEDNVNGGWSFAAPDGSARFIWSKDYSKSPIHDVMIEFDAKPFVDAGLDISKLPQGLAYNDKIMIGTKLGNDSLTYSEDATPLASYQQIVNLYRDRVKYHAALDHYGVDLSDKEMKSSAAFEWAKDMSTNDKDIVFVVDPKLFIDAGVDPAKVTGWVFAEVEMMDKDGKKEMVEKFLKPFNLK